MYHALDSIVRAGDIINLRVPSNTTLYNAQEVVFSLPVSGGVFINSSNISGTDISASNGIVHIIDDVLVPTDIVLGVFFGERNEEVLTYPNPVNGGSMFVEVNGKVNYSIYNAQGVLTLIGSINEGNAIQVDQLASGVYSLIINSENKVYHTTFVKY